MSKIAILTDSSCDIPQEMAEKYGIDIMSFHILLDDVDYVERESCTNTEFYDKMRLAKLSGHHRKELSQGFRLTTNNRMELMAVCVALETLKFEGSDVVIYSDSKYVVDAVSKGWVFGWVRKGFAGKKNPDLWMRFLSVYNRHNVRFVWVKGHAETVENNRCDVLAVAAANDRAHWLEDTGYDSAER